MERKTVSIECSGAAILDLDSFVHFQGNLKDLSTENYEKFKNEILEDGFSEPISVWKSPDGTVFTLNGHQRIRTLKHMRDQEGYQIPPLPINWVQARDVKQAKHKVLALTSQYGQMTEDGLYEFMVESTMEPKDIDNMRFSDLDMDSFKEHFLEDNPASSEGEDEVPAIPECTSVKLGDLFILGEHRVLCGDSTDPKQVERLMDGKLADMLFQDPPYGDGHAAMDVNSNGDKLVIKSHQILSDKNLNFLSPSVSAINPFLKEKCTKMMFFKWNKWVEVLNSTVIWGDPSAVCVWDRDDIGAAVMRFNPCHEFCFHWGSQLDKRSVSNLRNVWRCKKEYENKILHPTVKPIEILQPIIEVCTDKNDLVVDLFGGSGSTLIACEKSGRKCFMSELSPNYVSVILDRFEAFSGKKAIRSDGVPWEKIRES